MLRQEIQDEIIVRLGLARTQMFLAALLAHCEETVLALPDGGSELERIAHDLASTAGMLGLEDLSHRCRDLLTGEAERTQALSRLALSLTLAMAVLRQRVGPLQAAA